MRKTVRNVALAVSLLGLSCLSSGCASVERAFGVIGTLTATISNPVTPDMLYSAENAAIIVFAGLSEYRRSCIAGTVPAVAGRTCGKIIRQTQTYTRRVPGLLVDLRKFVRTNDQINAIVVYNTVQALIASAHSVAAKNNIGMQ